MAIRGNADEPLSVTAEWLEYWLALYMIQIVKFRLIVKCIRIVDGM